MAQFITAAEAAKLIPDQATMGIAAFGLSGWAEEVAVAIRDRFKETGHPCGLHLKQGASCGDWGYGNGFIGWEKNPREEKVTDQGNRGVTRFGEAGPGLITKWTSGHIGSAFTLNALTLENKIETHCIPQGVVVNLWREIAAGRPGLITKAGLGTFIDPRVDGGRMNSVPETEPVVKLIQVEGEDYLLYPSFKCDVALIRGSIADENGNISFEYESIMNEGLALAEATRNSGGIVIVQVEYLVKKETLDPKKVVIPGMLVDYVVVAQDPMSCWQAEGTYWQPAYSGHMRVPLSRLEALPMNERKVVCRRCAMEFRRGNLVNLGVGIPSDVAAVVAEEGYTDAIYMSSESGMVGGVPSALPSFGSAFNPECIMTPNTMFDLIDGGGLDVTILGIGEIDGDGNNNVSKMGRKLTGPGGFTNIVTKTKKVIFAGMFMGKARETLEDGKLKVLQEGTIRKFVDRVGQITYAGQYTPDDQEVLYITERCVFRLMDHKMVLTEIAPGIDLQKDILDQMGFTPLIADDLKEMDASIFRESWGEMGAYLDA